MDHNFHVVSVTLVMFVQFCYDCNEDDNMLPTFPNIKWEAYIAK